MKTVKEVSALTGVSVRTLHHYDAIGLLHPARVTEAGYRLYDEASLHRLQSILLLRELQFPLKEIKEILDSPGFDPTEALQQQIELLLLQRQHLDALIAHARQIQKAGVTSMNFAPFDKSQMEAYAAEAKKKWGQTSAYQEFEHKTRGQSPEQQKTTGDALMDIFAQFGAIRHLSPVSKEAQDLVGKLQCFITDNYYTCTRQILSSLGQMYIAGDSMTENIEKAGGPGTAAFASQAIEIYTK